mmetsp:Transcript_49673/g.153408  ORF Transcript_49673/g.153408 Transcript_49673/m.153408 type:complete len:185 (-) Transcript_49673:476-1030(-)
MYTNGPGGPPPDALPLTVGLNAAPGPSDEPDVVPVPPSGCGGCLQDNGTKMLTWKYVGEGHGNFQPRQSYDFVGQGRGSYDKEVVVTPGKWNMWKVLLCGSVPLVLLLIGLIAASMSGMHLPWGGMGAPARSSNEGLPKVSFNCQEGLNEWAAHWEQDKKECAVRTFGWPACRRWWAARRSATS